MKEGVRAEAHGGTMNSKLQSKPQKGFTLIEILLVIAILLAIGVMEMKREVAKSNEIVATAVGKQLALVGQAVDKYMVAKTNLLQTMTDPNCDSTGAYCTLNVAALISEGFLHAEFVNSVKFGGTYEVRVRRIAPPTPSQASLVCGIQPTPIGCPVPYPGGTIPAWQFGLQGLVSTTAVWTDNGSVPNWAMLGEAAKQAGPFAGVSQGGVPTGLFVGWSAPNVFGADLGDGRLVYVTGSQVTLWSQFVRRDGSLPMLGTLDMGANNIMNMRDMFINGPATNPRNKNLSSMMPHWVFKGVYSVDESVDPLPGTTNTNRPNFVPAPVCTNGGTPKIKVLMQLMKGTKAAYNNTQSVGLPAPSSDPVVDNAFLANNPAVHVLNSWAEDVGGGWLVHFQDRFNQTDKTGSSSVVKGSGLAELYCHYPNQ